MPCGRRSPREALLETRRTVGTSQPLRKAVHTACLRIALPAGQTATQSLPPDQARYEVTHPRKEPCQHPRTKVSLPTKVSSRQEFANPKILLPHRCCTFFFGLSPLAYPLNARVLTAATQSLPPDQARYGFIHPRQGPVSIHAPKTLFPHKRASRPPQQASCHPHCLPHHHSFYFSAPSSAPPSVPSSLVQAQQLSTPVSALPPPASVDSPPAP